MQELDLKNSFDVLSIARRWPRADANALDLASRLRTKADIAEERDRIERAIPGLIARERFWEGLGFLGIIVVFAAAVLGAFVVFDWFSLRQPIIEHIGTLAPRGVTILGVFWWILMLNLSRPACTARETLEAKLDLLQPVVDADCVIAAEYIESGRPEVLAWRDFAVYDREVLYAFDVGVLQALHSVSLASRSPAEKSAEREAARQALYGQSTPRNEGASHDA
jgi:hypothetical protein